MVVALDRRVVAVMFTDMAGYTALLQADPWSRPLADRPRGRGHSRPAARGSSPHRGSRRDLCGRRGHRQRLRRQSGRARAHRPCASLAGRGGRHSRNRGRPKARHRRDVRTGTAGRSGPGVAEETLQGSTARSARDPRRMADRSRLRREGAGGGGRNSTSRSTHAPSLTRFDGECMGRPAQHAVREVLARSRESSQA